MSNYHHLHHLLLSCRVEAVLSRTTIWCTCSTTRRSISTAARTSRTLSTRRCSQFVLDLQSNHNNSALPFRNRGPSPYSAASHSVSPQPPHFNAKVGGVSQNSHLQPPLQVDISQSPTYQFLQEEQDNRRKWESRTTSQQNH